MNKTRFRHGFLYAVPVLVYAVLIFIVSSITKFPDSTPSFFGFDKLAHFCEYYLFGFLSCRWVSAMETPFLKGRAVWITIILGTLYGLGDEWHQSFVPGREASLWDALFDSLGVLTAAGTYRMLTERIRSLNRSLNGPEREVIHEEKTGNHH